MKKLVFLVVAVLLASSNAQAVFTPPDSANLTVWYDAAVGVATDAGGVTTWTDKQNSVVASRPGSGQPQLVASGINSLPVVRFSGADGAATDMLQTPMDPFGGSIQGLTVFAVAQYAPGEGVLGMSNQGYSGSQAWVILASMYDGTNWVNRARIQTDSVYNGQILDGLTDTAAHIQSFRWEGGLGIHPNNPIDYQIDDTGYSGMTNGVWLASFTHEIDIGGTDHMSDTIGDSGYGGYDVDIAEILIYGTNLSDTDRDAVSAYLGGKYGIEVPEPATMILFGLGVALLRRRRA